MTAKHDLHDDELTQVMVKLMYEAQKFLEARGYRVNLVIHGIPLEVTDDTEQPNRA